MAYSVSEDINLFYLPHLRMKQLVVRYVEKMKETDFTSLSSVSGLLKFLKDTFLEFEYHEEIEENFIMIHLQNRMKSLSVEDPRIYKTHANIQINKVTSLIEDGIAMTKKSDLAGFGAELVEAINSFTSRFLPHMKEEEQVFQPLLVQYFGYNELKNIQDIVVKEHNCLIYSTEYETLDVSLLNLTPEILNTNSGAELIMNGINDSSAIVTAEKCNEVKINIVDLPSLITGKILSYLDHRDLGCCAQVCWSWNAMVYQPWLWRTISPVQWAEGVWNNDGFWNADQHKVMLGPTRKINNFAVNTPIFLGLCTIRSDDSDLAIIPPHYHEMFRRYKAEFKIFSGLVRYVFPRVGHAVRKLDLGASCTLNDQLLNIMLMQCPNVENLDVSYTALSFGAFRGMKGVGSCRRLKVLSFAGCTNLEDSSVLSLTKCWEDYSFPEDEDSSTLQSVISVRSLNLTEMDLHNMLIGHAERNVKLLTQGVRGESYIAIPYIKNAEINEISGLTALNVSGCSKLSDKSIEELMKVKHSLVNLGSLDLSGCYRFSGRTLNNFVKCCPRLSPENLFYCDHIRGGPYSNEANGCCNLQSSQRACCVPFE